MQSVEIKYKATIFFSSLHGYFIKPFHGQLRKGPGPGV